MLLWIYFCFPERTEQFSLWCTDDHDWYINVFYLLNPFNLYKSIGDFCETLNVIIIVMCISKNIMFCQGKMLHSSFDSGNITSKPESSKEMCLEKFYSNWCVMLWAEFSSWKMSFMTGSQPSSLAVLDHPVLQQGSRNYSLLISSPGSGSQHSSTLSAYSSGCVCHLYIEIF